MKNNEQTFRRSRYQKMGSRFLALPTEVRLMIYDYLRPTHTKHHRLHAPHEDMQDTENANEIDKEDASQTVAPTNMILVVKSIPAVNLTRTCRQIYQELGTTLTSDLKALHAEPARLIIDPATRDTKFTWESTFINKIVTTGFDINTVSQAMSDPRLRNWLLKIKQHQDVYLHNLRADNTTLNSRFITHELPPARSPYINLRLMGVPNDPYSGWAEVWTFLALIDLNEPFNFNTLNRMIYGRLHRLWLFTPGEWIRNNIKKDITERVLAETRWGKHEEDFEDKHLLFIKDAVTDEEWVSNWEDDKHKDRDEVRSMRAVLGKPET
ncbi:unnamed protein product [Periconia digitata]|uniref:DUF7730 domain-containing protein n=1 Tax=Periconia digitata TaxID=1303443 RepID=A0A9W4XLQ8_9PLEO|nr:unnamed protein product [Periconia digitata]